MQTICDVRIDERLIHGQVATLWQGLWRCSRIVVIDNESATNEMFKSILKISCPPGVKLSVLTVEKAAKNLSDEKYLNDRITVVTKVPKNLVELYQFGFKINEVTVGNMSNAPHKTVVTPTVSVSDEDVKYFHDLDNLNVALYSQMVPSSDRLEFMPLLKKALNK
ncbi:MAG: PTS sugar transporter subunit IIB [Erysipelotrichaceae bacterium]|nr:PTS sugar transporter subunit IIB [Erysipelotrichaceae bacterium]MDD4642674.1 PTS sugar transporter subunit IIB [Erysipelotrichaceae bacterium]